MRDSSKMVEIFDRALQLAEQYPLVGEEGIDLEAA
jgi:hypothetical protein